MLQASAGVQIVVSGVALFGGAGYLAPFSIVLHAVSLRALATARTAVRAYS